ncbi:MULTISPECIES: NifB/NifX family molybdenum-iron cluster-binding protein [Helicobacter]|uniref:Dinitrogenase iron-molybdenum cofactor biosynthesis domain-containing protein n=1 Tax=Helicobacter ibis TaxID=2962633 RepID=A0ABT4VBH3_9HELI|nr:MULTISPECIES: hypothetical protein [Helicobacter]MDA3966834.1 hypothetical protein [Helicobacter sp. WB40]MDA3968064.1 hypothetical protein [Helicobacter ibis]
MKIAIPVYDDSLRIFTNTGHTPFFAIFEQVGSGMFKKIDFVELRHNPRGNVEASEGCSHNDSDMSEEEQIAHKLEHNILGEIIKDCQVVLVKKACKNTAKVFNEYGIKICKIETNCLNAKDSFVYIK